MTGHTHDWKLEPMGTHRDAVYGECGCGAKRKFSNGAEELDHDFAWAATINPERRALLRAEGSLRGDEMRRAERDQQRLLDDAERHSIQTATAA